MGLTTYTTKIRPLLEYASPVWSGIPNYLEEELEYVQQRSLKILGLKKDALPTLKERREKATTNELKRIQDDPGNPCNRILGSYTGKVYWVVSLNSSATLQNSFSILLQIQL